MNFHHAANVLGTTQSSVSARIKALEENLGILLFERRHRGVRLTEARRHFVAEVTAGIAHLDHAVRTVGAMIDGVEGQLAVGLHSPIAAGFLADLRRRYRASYPMVEQSVLEGRSSETVALIREGTLDVAFVVGAVNAPDCHSRLLWSEPMVGALPADHRLAERQNIIWLDLADEIFLIRHGGTGPQVFEHVVRRISERDRSPRIHRCDVARDTLMGMVAVGDGITLTSEATTHVPVPGVVFRLIADETEPARFSAVWSPHNRNPAVQARLKSRNPMVTPARISSGPTLLTGICFCAKCGGAMTMRTGRGNGGQYTYYTCLTKARQGGAGCEGRSIRMDKLRLGRGGAGDAGLRAGAGPFIHSYRSGARSHPSRPFRHRCPRSDPFDIAGH